MKLKLKYPFTIPGGARVEALEMRRPRVKDLKAAQRAGEKDAEQELALMALLITPAMTPEDIEEMDLADYRAIQATFREMVGTD